MNDHTTESPYFPENLEDYAPWVAQHGLRAPYGECQCGCGQAVSIAEKTNSKAGRKRGMPIRFVHGHNGVEPDNAPSGFKTCAHCREIKPLEQFYPDQTAKRTDAYRRLCKDCKRTNSLQYYYDNREDMIAANAAFRQTNKEKLAAAERVRRADPVYREQRAARLKSWRERNQEHVADYNRSLPVKARAAVNKAVLRGDFPPPSAMVCEGCQEAVAAHYHHTHGYRRRHWFNVVALCTECHGREHRID